MAKNSTLGWILILLVALPAMPTQAQPGGAPDFTLNPADMEIDIMNLPSHHVTYQIAHAMGSQLDNLYPGSFFENHSIEITMTIKVGKNGPYGFETLFTKFVSFVKQDGKTFYQDRQNKPEFLTELQQGTIYIHRTIADLYPTVTGAPANDLVTTSSPQIAYSGQTVTITWVETTCSEIGGRMVCRGRIRSVTRNIEI